MIHNYQLFGGSLKTAKYSNLTSVYFDFFVHDNKTLLTFNCWYGSDIADSKKFDDAAWHNKVHRNVAGVGNQITPLPLHKPLDSSQFKVGAICSLSVAGKGSADPGTATLLMHKLPSVQFVFSILADFNSIPVEKMNGSIQWLLIGKTRHPKILPDPRS